MDAGALLFEFYQEVIQKIKEEYFERSDERRIPKCHWGSAASMSSLKVDALPSAEDIPRNASTNDLLEMINQIS